MDNHSFLAVGQLFKKGYNVTFRINAVATYTSAGKPILKGKRDFNTGLWRINLRHETPQHTMSVASNVYELLNTGELVNYLHKAMFSPTTRTVIS
jgi:hypothetical protein